MQYAYIGLAEALSVTPTQSEGFYIADIPDILLFQNKELQCYVYVEDNDSGVTVYELDMTIMPRAKPADSQYTPQQISNYDALVGQMNDLIDETEALRDGLDDITDAATEATEGAEAITNKLLNSTATVTMLDPGETATAEVQQTSTGTVFSFSLPKTDISAYVTFYVNMDDGCLYMSTIE